MANYRRGKAASKAATERTGGGRFYPTHQFISDETTFLQFLQSWEEIPTVLMHRFITVGYREDGSKIYRDFISPLDESQDGATGSDPLVTRFGSNPKERNIALAVEVKPQYEKKGTRKVIVGWDVATREYTTSEGEKKEVPNVALVNESPYTFFNHLGVVDDTHPIEENIFQITRTGEKKDISFTIIPVGEPLNDDELSEAGVGDFFEEFDFDGYLDELADQERLHAEIDPLPDDFPVNPYAKKNKKGGSGKSEPSRSTRSRRAKDEPEDEVEVEVPEDEEPEEDAAPRKRRFERMKTEINS